MKRIRMSSWVVAIALLAFAAIFASPKALATAPELYIREINITGDEFLALQAGSAINHLNNYWVGYVNNSGSLAAPSQQLPDIALGAGQVIILSSNPTQVCDASYVTKLSFSGFNNPQGAVALWEQSSASFDQIENVTWGAAGSPNPSIVIATESHITPSATNAVWYNDGSENWVVGNLEDCTLNGAIDQSNTLLGSIIQWSRGSSPPAVIVNLAADSSTVGLPKADVGLKAPQITEVLPNPTGTGTDNTDEFIELYNPNNSTFDLSNFVLETGLSTKHKFTFGSGTKISAKGYAAFYSSATHLSLSNTSGQATLLDPLGQAISQSDVYSSAKDGQSWALANGNWYWSTSPTPGAANIVNQSSGSSSSAGVTPSGGNVRGASTSGSGGSSSFSSTATSPTPIHSGTLVGVGAAAVLYACYEYRNDLANHVYRLRRYVQARRAAGK